MNEVKKLDKRESLRIVTDNGLIDAQDLSRLSLNARKLFYVAVSQCKQSDKELYEYETTPAELADMWGIDRSNVYREADKITTELMKIIITLRTGKKSFQKRHLFEKCNYDDAAKLTFKLHNEMTDLLLGLKKDFSKPLVWDFMKMRSPYSMAIWHLFQKEMGSFKPMMTQQMIFEITLDELRAVTGTENKLKQIGQFKERVLDKAIKEIKRNCFVEITYRNIKRNRRIVAFSFTARSVWGYQDVSDMPYRLQKRMRKADLIRKRGEGALSPDEQEELLDLISELEQLTLEDVANGYPIE